MTEGFWIVSYSSRGDNIISQPMPRQETMQYISQLVKLEIERFTVVKCSEMYLSLLAIKG